MQWSSHGGLPVLYVKSLCRFLAEARVVGRCVLTRCLRADRRCSAPDEARLGMCRPAGNSRSVKRQASVCYCCEAGSKHTNSHGHAMHAATPDRALQMESHDRLMGHQCLSSSCGVACGTRRCNDLRLYGHRCTANMPSDQLDCLAHA